MHINFSPSGITFRLICNEASNVLYSKLGRLFHPCPECPLHPPPSCDIIFKITRG